MTEFVGSRMAGGMARRHDLAMMGTFAYTLTHTKGWAYSAWPRQRKWRERLIGFFKEVS